MQCPSCRAVYSNGLDLCPRCKTPASRPSTETQLKADRPQSGTAASGVARESRREISASERPLEATGTSDVVAAAQAEPPQPVSTLIEFPGAGRANRPQWRKELSERVREIQERRARDAEREARELAQRKLDQQSSPAPSSLSASAASSTASPAAQNNAAPPSPQLGLVPQPDAPAVNPIVAAALKRIERARQTSPMTAPRGRTGGAGGAATAVARVAEEQFEDETQNASLLAPAPVLAAPPLVETKAEAVAEKPSETARGAAGLVVVPPPPAPKPVEKTETVEKPSTVEKTETLVKPQPKRVFAEVVDDSFLDRLEAPAPLPLEQPFDDRAPVFKRVAAALIDLMVVAFASTPFAAIIELTNGNWTDARVASSMGGIILLVMFLYLTASTALTGRTWGMSLVSLRAVDVENGNSPTTSQSVWRALLYMLSLATAGLGILYALFDAEGRTAHDHLSGTAVVRE